MRFYIFGLVLLGSVAAPAFAQTNSRLEQRLEKLEREVQTVQRRVTGGAVDAEIQPETRTPISGDPATDSLADMNARIDALEGQLARLTGASEENGFRIRQLEDALSQYRYKTDNRLQEVERTTAPPPPPPSQPSPGPATTGAARPAPQGNVATAPPTTALPSTGDAGEDAYLTGFRQWEAGEMAAAQKSLEVMAKKYPKHRRASYALNLAGRAYLDDGKPATAAKLFLSNYQTNPKGERAADSLYFLGEALLRLKKPAEACKVYDELADVYPDMRDWVKQHLPKARADAKCK
jgi:TolA-binding protein